MTKFVTSPSNLTFYVLLSFAVICLFGSVGDCHGHPKVENKIPLTSQVWTQAMLATLFISAAPILLLLFIPIHNAAQSRPFLNILLAFAMGGLLGDVFLHLLPHTFNPHDHSAHDHDHDHDHAPHSHSHGFKAVEDPVEALFRTHQPKDAALDSSSDSHSHKHDHHHDHDHDHAHDHDHDHAHEHNHDHVHDHHHDHEHHAHEHNHDHAHEHDHHHDHAHDHDHHHDHAHDHDHEHAHDHDHHHDHAHEHDHHHDHEHNHDHAHEHNHDHAHEHNHEHDHEHKHEHDHEHKHDHGHEHHKKCSHDHGHGDHGHDDHDHSKGIRIGLFVIIGIFLFLIVEKTLRNLTGGHGHSHSHGKVEEKKHEKAKGKSPQSSQKKDSQPQPHEPISKVSGFLNLAADFTHNFTDGLAIGATFIAGERMGMITTFAILLHEIPHEIGDFAILVHSGFSKWQAMKLQLVTAVGALLGTAIGLLTGGLDSVSEIILPLTAGGFIYIATVSVIPELLADSTKFSQTIKEILAASIGVGLMTLIAFLE